MYTSQGGKPGNLTLAKVLRPSSRYRSAHVLLYSIRVEPYEYMNAFARAELRRGVAGVRHKTTVAVRSEDYSKDDSQFGLLQQSKLVSV